jgi:TRAP-type mannitol/chloroaromatic compound transport system permease small subunit
MELSMTEDNKEIPKLCKALDGLIERIGAIIAWLNVVLIGVIILQVVLRYVFSMGLVVLEELQWHLYAACIIIGLSYCLVQDAHIRLDLLHDRFSQRRKEIIELIGIIFLLIPMTIIIIMHSLPFLAESWRITEHSDSPVGLPFRFIIKAFIPLGFGLLGLAGVSRLIRATVFLITTPKGK